MNVTHNIRIEVEEKKESRWLRAQVILNIMASIRRKYIGEFLL